jgi:hypothetical protein
MDAEVVLLFHGFYAVRGETEMTMGNLEGVQVYSPAISLWERFNPAHPRSVSQEFPAARAYLGSGPLLLNGRFEMMGIAVKCWLSKRGTAWL